MYGGFALLDHSLLITIITEGKNNGVIFFTDWIEERQEKNSRFTVPRAMIDVKVLWM